MFKFFKRLFCDHENASRKVLETGVITNERGVPVIARKSEHVCFNCDYAWLSVAYKNFKDTFYRRNLDGWPLDEHGTKMKLLCPEEFY
jgi:hypothetical protein